MSHFTVLVIGKEPEKQLAPYHEFECTGFDDEYIQDVDKTEEHKKDFLARNEENKTKYPTFKKYLEEYEEIKEKDDSEDSKYSYFETDEKGEVIKVVRRTNPNAQWDWYQLGGRWTGAFKLKPNTEGEIGKPGLMTEGADLGTYNQTEKKNIDFSVDKETFETNKRWYEVVIDGDKPKNQKEKKWIEHNFYKKEYYTERYNNKEDYAKRQTEFSTYAVIKNGKWYSPGDMGWWGCSSESVEDKKKWEKSFFKHWIKDLPNDTLLSVYDCHI